MQLGEKICKLRKEKGLSQEALAEQIGTTRQAVSKWENNQGYPETEKLLRLSKLFAVSTDFLLKDDKPREEKSENGFYVNQEMARGYLAHEKRIGSDTGLCFLFWAMAGIPYVMFPSDTCWRFLGIAVCVVLGIGFAVHGMLIEQQDYKILKEEPLLLDDEFLKALTAAYHEMKRKYFTILAPCTMLFLVGMIVIALTIKGWIAWSQYHAFVFLGFGIGLFGFAVSVSMLEAYELLIQNERHCNRFFFKLKKKWKETIDR